MSAGKNTRKIPDGDGSPAPTGSMSPPGSAFHLSKFYLDCITDDGTALIIYAATVKWRRLEFSCVSLLENPPGAPSRTWTLMRAYDSPAWSGGGLRFEFAPLGISACWRAADAPLVHPLLKTGDGEVIWTCLAPRARATITRRGQPARGTGYAEHLLLDIPPWRLPVKNLHWGRFHSATDSLVWIKWLGEHPLDLVLHNGVALGGTCEVSPSHVRTRSLTLDMTNARELRSGRIIETALRPLRALAGVFPGSILGLRETKWVSDAVLAGASASTTPNRGLALHEHVIFPGGNA